MLGVASQKEEIEHGRILQLLWNSFFASLLLKDDSGRLLACNDAFVRFTRNRTDRELIGKLPSEYWDPGQGRVFERYDATVRALNRPVLTREVFSETVRFTARWPVNTSDDPKVYGSVSIYMIPAIDVIKVGRIPKLGQFVAVPPWPEICASFFESCPWAVTVREPREGRFLFVNRAYRLLFTPPDEAERGSEMFIGQLPEDTCAEAYWRKHERYVSIAGPEPAASLKDVEHPCLPACPRKVVQFKVYGEGTTVFRGTLGVDAEYLNRLKNTRPLNATYIEPFVVPLDARR
jgi:PAS domain-containing protein